MAKYKIMGDEKKYNFSEKRAEALERARQKRWEMHRPQQEEKPPESAPAPVEEPGSPKVERLPSPEPPKVERPPSPEPPKVERPPSPEPPRAPQSSLRCGKKPVPIHSKRYSFVLRRIKYTHLLV